MATVGIGGLAIAFAGRPTPELIVGGFTLFADKPVRVGDFCPFWGRMRTDEPIGLRSIRLRRLDDTLVSLPNADFSQRELTNCTLRRQHRYRATLGFATRL